MGDYPRELLDGQIPPRLASLICELAERLLGGATAEHLVLRRQLAAARVARVTLTGAGFFAYFAHPPEAETVSPSDMIGGDVPMNVPGLDAGAGCLVKVTAGRLAFLEVYTFGSTQWPDEPPSPITFGEATPLPIP